MFRGLILVRIIPREINTQGEEFKKNNNNQPKCYRY